MEVEWDKPDGEWNDADADFLMFGEGGGDCLDAIANENDVDWALDLFGSWASKKVTKAKEKVQAYRGVQFKEELRTERFSYFQRNKNGVQRVSKCMTYKVKYKNNEQTGLPEEIDKTLSPDEQEQKLYREGWELVGEELVDDTVEEEKEVVTNSDWDVASRGACKALEYGTQATYNGVAATGVTVVNKLGVVNTALAPYAAYVSKTTAPYVAKILMRLDPCFMAIRFASGRVMVCLQNRGAQFANAMSFYLGPYAAKMNTALAPYFASASYTIAVNMAKFNAKLVPLTVRISATTGLAITKLSAWSSPLRCQIYAAAAPLYLGAQAVYLPFKEQYSQSFAPLCDGMASAFGPMIASASTCFEPVKANFKAMMYPIIYPHMPLTNLSAQIWVAMMPIYSAASNTIYPLRQSVGSAVSPIYASMRAYVEPVRCAAACAVGPAWANLKVHWEPLYERCCATAFPVLVQANTVIVPPVARATAWAMPKVVTLATSTACATAIVHEKTQGVVGACGRGLTSAGTYVNSQVSQSCVADVVAGAAVASINVANARTAEALAGATADSHVAMAEKQAKLMEAWEAQDAKILVAAPGAGQLAVRAAEQGEDIVVTAARVILKTMRRRKQHIKHFQRGEEKMSLEVEEQTVTQEVRGANVGLNDLRLMNANNKATPAITNQVQNDGLDVQPLTGALPKDENTQNFMESRRRKLKGGQHGNKAASKAKGSPSKSSPREASKHSTPKTNEPGSPPNSDASSPVSSFAAKEEQTSLPIPAAALVVKEPAKDQDTWRADLKMNDEEERVKLEAEKVGLTLSASEALDAVLRGEDIFEDSQPERQDFDAELLSAPMPPQAETPASLQQEPELKKMPVEVVKPPPSPEKTQVTVDMLEDFWDCT